MITVNTISYIILIYNQDITIPALADSLKKLQGDFRKEFIIIDDGSDDASLEVIQKEFSSFPRTTILKNEEYFGPAYSVNKALALANGKYVQIIDGCEMLHPQSTMLLLNAMNSMGSNVACSLYGLIDENDNKYTSVYDTGDIVTIDSPIKPILENSIPFIRQIGFGGTLILRSLLDEITLDDSKVFLHNMSLALTLGKFSRFALIKETLCYRYYFMDDRYEEKFSVYNDLVAILDFMENHSEIASKYTSELYKALWRSLWHLGKRYKIKAIPKYFLSRYIAKNLSIDSLSELYKEYISELA